MSVTLWLEIGAIGGAGSVLRFLVDGAISSRVAGEFPWGTLAVNVSGSFVLGLLAGAAVGGDALLLAGAATVGSYTTFSTWMLETHHLGEDGERALLALNVGASLAAGLGAAELGRLVGAA